MAAEVLGAGDLDLLLWQLQLIRDRIAAHREANKA
jgi:hypothetical protein